MANLPVYNTMRTGLPNIDAFLAEPSNQPPNSPPYGRAGRRSSPSPLRRCGHAPSPEPYLREEDISKFKSTITFDGTSNLTSFLFAMDKACAKYSLTSDWNRMLVMGECLRGGALDWWTLQDFHTYDEAVSSLQDMYDDLGRPGDHLQKLNRLIQRGTTRDYFQEAEKLNLYARLPEKALWMILEQGLSPGTRAAMAAIDPPPKSFAIWKKKALTIGATLDTLNARSSKFNDKPNKSRHNSSTSKDDRNVKEPTRTQREMRRKEGSCTNCGEHGDWARECPSRKGKSSPPKEKTWKGKEKDTRKESAPKEVKIME